jgi:hypothetical protein
VNEQGDDQVRGDDAALLARLAAALEVDDAVPAHVRAAARGAFTWSTIDAELAELTTDTWERPLAGVRHGGSDERELAFQADDVEIELLVHGGPERRVVGQLLAAGPATAELERPDGTTVDLGVDALGRFSATGLHDGPLRIVVHLADRRIHTEWFLA